MGASPIQYRRRLRAGIIMKVKHFCHGLMRAKYHKQIMHSPPASRDFTYYASNSRQALDIKQNSKWQHNNSAMPAIDISLPVAVMVMHGTFTPARKMSTSDRVYNTQSLLARGWHLVSDSTLVVFRDTAMPNKYVISSLFINSSTDPRLRTVMEGATKVWDGMKHYNKAVHFTPNPKPGIQAAGRAHAGLGQLRMDGLCNRRYASGCSYYLRNDAADGDVDFQLQQSLQFAGMATLERCHVPAIADFKLSLAKREDFAGVFPGLPTELNSASAVGASQSYASSPHSDSCIKGATESIFWTNSPNLPRTQRWTFCNVPAKLLFDLGKCADKRGSCCLYIPGSTSHGTVCTGVPHCMHQGLGFVLLSKHLFGPTKQLVK